VNSLLVHCKRFPVVKASQLTITDTEDAWGTVVCERTRAYQ